MLSKVTQKDTGVTFAVLKFWNLSPKLTKIRQFLFFSQEDGSKIKSKNLKIQKSEIIEFHSKNKTRHDPLTIRFSLVTSKCDCKMSWYWNTSRPEALQWNPTWKLQIAVEGNAHLQSKIEWINPPLARCHLNSITKPVSFGNTGDSALRGCEQLAWS